MGLSGVLVTGNAGDIVPVRVSTHLLAWPRNLGNLSDCSYEHFLLFVGTKPFAQCQSGTSGEDQEGLYYGYNR